jgi:hypothetical protein
VRLLAIVMLGIGALGTLAPAAMAAGCFAIPGSATLSGRLTVEWVRSASAGAIRKAGRVFILRVSEAVCARPKPGTDQDDITAQAADRVRRIHVFAVDDERQTALMHVVGRPVEITGDLASAHTRHHRAPLIFAVQEVHAVSRPGRR